MTLHHFDILFLEGKTNVLSQNIRPNTHWCIISKQERFLIHTAS